MAHWEYAAWAASSPIGLAAAWRYAPRAFLMLVGGLTKDPQRSKQCAEMLRLQRKDAGSIQSYLADPPARLPSQLPQSAAHPARRRRSSSSTGSHTRNQTLPHLSARQHQAPLSFQLTRIVVTTCI